MPLIAHNIMGLGIGTIGALLTASSIANLIILRFISTMVRRFGRPVTHDRIDRDRDRRARRARFRP